MDGKLIQVNGISIWYQTFGNSEDPATLLMMGNGAQGIFWPDEFCEKLADQNRFVIRYDYRDTGLSTTFDFKENPYSFHDHIADARGLLSALHIKKAHIIGLSMGGYIAQLYALNYPDEVLSLAILMSTSDYSVLLDALTGTKPESSLPPMKPEFLAKIAAIDPALNEVEKMVENWRAANGEKADFDEKFWRDLQTAAFARAKNPKSNENHMKAAHRTKEENLLPLIPQLKMPVVVIQGKEDPIFPEAHGEATHSAIPHSRLIVVEKMGHALSPDFYGDVIKAACSI